MRLERYYAAKTQDAFLSLEPTRILIFRVSAKSTAEFLHRFMLILLAAIATFVTDFATDFRPLDRDSFYYFAIDYSIISSLCTLDMCSVVRQSLFHGAQMPILLICESCHTLTFPLLGHVKPRYN
jgi:hypothetical protein